jgi:hypothetical protein
MLEATDAKPGLLVCTNFGGPLLSVVKLDSDCEERVWVCWWNECAYNLGTLPLSCLHVATETNIISFHTGDPSLVLAQSVRFLAETIKGIEGQIVIDSLNCSIGGNNERG